MKFLANPKAALATFLFFLPIFLFGQTENCTNGLDDDADGLIDCYDTDCTCTGQCDDFYYTTCNADCYYVPPCGQVSLGIQWTSDAETGTYSPLVAGDMDADGIPDVVTTRVENPDLYIIDGGTGLTKIHVVNPNTVWPGGTAPAIADLDHDGFGEVVIVGFDRLLYCYEHDGTLKYTSAIQVGYQDRYRYSVPNIADFDHDGWAEVNIGNQVFNGQTGALLAQGGPNVSSGEHPARVAVGFSFASPVPMDVLPDSFCPDCDGLEIVAGNQVLSVDLATGTVTPRVTAAAPFTDGFTSVADFDRDGDLDAIVQGRRNGQNMVYCWEIENPTIMRQYQLLNNWPEGASRVNVADLDGDGQLEISFVSHPRLYALRNNFTALWIRNIVDVSSITCSSVFDFCGDGSADIVYRGQDKLQILNGATGAITWEDDCLSATHIENPLILDVDADGQTEIIIECGTNGTQDVGTVIAYEAIGTPGIASRKVWNQHAYFNTNINDDLSVPRYQQNPHIIGDSLRMNTFLNQFFNPTFPSPDGVLNFQNVVCDRDSLILTVEICNVGDNIFPQQTPISAYIGNPQTTAAQWAGATPIGFDVGLGECQTFTFRIPRITNDSVFLVLNDDNSTPPPFNLNSDFPVTAIGECGFGNNIASFFIPYLPDTISLGPDTAICDNTILPLNASGFDLIGWQWTGGTTLSTFTVQSPGTYSVTVTDVCLNIQIDSIVVGIDSSTVVTIGQDQAICKGETVALGESGFDFYNWTSSASLSCPNCDSVTVSPSNSALVVLEAGFLNGCVNRDSVFVTVYDTFNYAVDTIICYGRTVLWNGLSIQPDSSHLFPLQTIHGCDSTVLVRVHGTGLGTYNITVDTAVCLGTTLSIHNAEIAPDGEMSFSLVASTGCDSTVLVRVAPLDTFYLVETRVICYGDSSNIFGAEQTTTGDYKGSFTAANGCDSTHLVSLFVLPQIQVDIGTTVACFDEADASLTATVFGIAPPFFYVWNFFGNHVPQVDNLPAGNYSLTVTDANNCTETESVTIEEHPQTFFTTEIDSAQCFDEYTGFIGIRTDDPTLLFEFNGSAFDQTYDHPNLHAGTYFVVSQDVFGCYDTIAATVLQPPQLSINLPADTSIQLGLSLPLQIDLGGLTPVQWIWSDTSYLSCLTCPDPVVQTPLETTRYTLTITDKNGCEASDDLLLMVEQIIGVFIPNAIGGTDENANLQLGFNPAVRRVGLFRVFDRWGELLHETRNVLPGDAALTWDGRFRGKLVNPGVYLWQIELELVDGSVVKKVGDLTVLR
ncbi:MAG: FG-GAP-like repeat-containing protein [Saprospiraceae bacterium]